MQRSKIICVGGVTLDRVMHVDELPGGAGKTVAEGFFERGGGMASTAAAAIAALGGDVELWTRVGDDFAGRQLLDELEQVGVPTRSIRICSRGRSATSFVHVDRAGERCLTNYRGDLPPDPGWLPLADLDTCAAMLGDTRWREGVAAAFASARKHGIPRILDADAGSLEALRELVPLADHVIFSAQGLEQLTGLTAPEDGLAKVAETQLNAQGVLGVTMGEAGSVWLVGGDLSRVPSIAVAVENTNGVGDVFHGAYALAASEGMASPRAATFATATAALKCAKPGGWEHMPKRNEVSDLLCSLSA